MIVIGRYSPTFGRTTFDINRVQSCRVHSNSRSGFRRSAEYSRARYECSCEAGRYFNQKLYIVSRLQALRLRVPLTAAWISVKFTVNSLSSLLCVKVSRIVSECSRWPNAELYTPFKKSTLYSVPTVRVFVEFLFKIVSLYKAVWFNSNLRFLNQKAFCPLSFLSAFRDIWGLSPICNTETYANSSWGFSSLNFP